MSMDYPKYCPHCRANVEDCEEHHAGRAPFPGFGPGVCPLVKERDELVAALRPFAEAQGVADLRSARAESDYLLASDHIRPSAFRIARDAIVRIDSKKGSRR